MNLKLTPPKEITFGIAVILGLLGLFSFLGVLTLLPIEAFWLLFFGFALLALSVLFRDL
jgi:predicted membrane channel-forming protein YqfA (hemolysin III family)